MKFKLFAYLTAIFAVLVCAGNHSTTETFTALALLVSGMGITPGFSLGACVELDAFRIRTEDLDQEIIRSPRLGRAMFWRNLIRRGVFARNAGVVRSTFNMKASEPQDNQAFWNAITLTNGALPACTRTYEDVGVDFYEKTYGPRERSFRGPVVCKRHLQFAHEAERFLTGYQDELGKFVARVWELTLRRDYVNFVPIYVDGRRYSGPNALATAPAAAQGLSQSNLNLMAAESINLGAGAEPNGYTTFEDAGPIFPLEIDMVDSEGILRSNATIRQDARDASSGRDGEGNFAVWKAIGAQRVIGNYRHVTTNTPLRLNWVGGAYQVVTPFKDITEVGSDSNILTDAYKNAGYGVAIQMSPDVFTAEAVLPFTWPYKTIDGAPDPMNYNGEWEFIAGGERICTPAEYDPLHEKGRHFAVISYAPRPERTDVGAALIYRRDLTPQNEDAIFFS